jgi:hypothetical protein
LSDFDYSSLFEGLFCAEDGNLIDIFSLSQFKGLDLLVLDMADFL